MKLIKENKNMSEKMNFQPEEEKLRHEVKIIDLKKVAQEGKKEESQDAEGLIKIQEETQKEKAQAVVSGHQAEVLDLGEIRKAQELAQIKQAQEQAEQVSQKQMEIKKSADAEYNKLRADLIKEEEAEKKGFWSRLFGKK